MRHGIRISCVFALAYLLIVSNIAFAEESGLRYGTSGSSSSLPSYFSRLATSTQSDSRTISGSTNAFRPISASTSISWQSHNKPTTDASAAYNKVSSITLPQPGIGAIRNVAPRSSATNTPNPPSTEPFMPTLGATPSMISPRSSGLVESFPDGGRLSQWANIYDQALPAIYFVTTGNNDATAAICSAYQLISQTEVNNGYPAGNFSQFYKVDSGEWADGNQFTGDNSWVGISILTYTAATENSQYMGLAQTIGDNLMSRDAADDGKDGIRLCNKDASTDYKKYSTEQNIDAYVFFKALGAQTGDQKYTNEAESITKFVQNMYNKSLGYFNAGIKEDGNANTKFATDVQSMAIMAYGKDGLAAMGVKCRRSSDKDRKQR